MTASPRAVLGEPLDELERLAKAASAVEGWVVATPGVLATTPHLALIAYCTPERIAQLVALARENERDAERWRALAGCQRVRVLGHAELGTPFQHIGFELWEQFPAADIRPGANEMSRADLTTFADAAASRRAATPTEDSR